MNSLITSTTALRANAAATAKLMRALGNTSRLLILCRLFQHGESSAGSLAAELGIGLSALSQHLNRMREEGLVSQRRQSRQVFYRISEASSSRLPTLLASICEDSAPATVDDHARPSTVAAALALAFPDDGSVAADGFWQAATITGAGKIHPLPQAAYQPDPGESCKVVFGMTMAPAHPAQINPALQRVARTGNLYANAGIPLGQLQFVAVASAGATVIALDDAHHLQQYGTPNPNLPIIQQLRQAGVDVAVCGQAIAEHHYPFDGLDQRVTLALSALTTITQLQQKGYALMPL